MTELIWDGKYKDGKKVSPVRIALPFQTIETVNESVQERQRTLDLFFSGRDPEWRNRLIWGDKKYVLPSLLPQFAGKINLIYIDPPFDTGANFSFTATIPDNPDTEENETSEFTKEPSVIEQKAYRDTWSQGLDSYLHWFYETVILLRELLTEDGNIYVHIGPNMAHYARVIMDEVFGYERLFADIAWKRTTQHGNASKKPGYVHDRILAYTCSENYKYREYFHVHDPKYIETFFRHSDERGRYRIADLSNPDFRPNLMYEYKGYKPPRKGWAVSLERMKQMDAEGRLYFPKDINGRIQRKQYLNDLPGIPLIDIWTDISPIGAQSNERTNYATQKPELLLQRMLEISSDKGDLILDCFCGSGTSVAVAEKMGRRWITCDLGRFSIHTTRKRLLSIPNVRPFIVQNLGKYERQSWQVAEFSNTQDQTRKELNYRKFILDLYKANMVTGYSWLHGIKNGRMVHVGSVDAPVTLADVKSISAEVWKSVGKGKDSPEKAAVDILGWDFALEVNEVAKQIAAESKVEVALKKIPQEVLEKKAVEQGDIKFFELASLSVKIEKKAMEAKVALSDFVIPPQDVPEEVQKAITHWSQWIDYWAIDWDYKDDTFHNQWQSYRTRKNPKIELEAAHVYKEPGEYKIAVKVIDILGNDTTKLMNIKVTSAPSKVSQKENASRR